MVMIWCHWPQHIIPTSLTSIIFIKRYFPQNLLIVSPKLLTLTLFKSQFLFQNSNSTIFIMIKSDLIRNNSRFLRIPSQIILFLFTIKDKLSTYWFKHIKYILVSFSWYFITIMYFICFCPYFLLLLTYLSLIGFIYFCTHQK